MKNKNTTIITVGIGAEVDTELMLEVASTPGDFFNTTNFSTLQNEIERIISTVSGYKYL